MARTPRTKSEVKEAGGSNAGTPRRESARTRSKAKEPEAKAAKAETSSRSSASKPSRTNKKGTAKVKGKTMSKVSLEDYELYRIVLTGVKKRIQNMRTIHPNIMKFDENTPGIETADFRSDLKMDRSSLQELRSFVSTCYFTTIEPGDGHDIKCIQDMAKYILYLQMAKRVAGLSPFQSTFDPAQREVVKYKNRLAKVTEIVKLYSRKKGEIDPSDDFEQDLGMSKDDVFLLFFHIQRDVAKKCPFDMLDAGYMCRIRCCQDMADLLHGKYAFYPTPVDEDEERFRDDDPFN